MQFSQVQKASAIAELINARIIGDAELELSGINEIHKIKTGDIAFVDHPKYYDKCIDSDASAIIINAEVDPRGKTLFVVDDPVACYNKLAKHYQPRDFYPSERGYGNTIHPEAKIAPGVIIGSNVQIGEGSIIHPNVTIYDNVSIGKNVIVHANTVLGGDAFYFNKRKEGFYKLHSSGKVVIEDNVEIGAACTIDKGVSGATVIGEGSKLDNQIHLGHGVVIGRECLIAAQVGIAGKTILGDRVTIWGQVGISKSLHIGDDVTILAQSGVKDNLESGKTYFGYPASEARYQMRLMAYLKKMPEVWDKVKNL